MQPRSPSPVVPRNVARDLARPARPLARAFAAITLALLATAALACGGASLPSSPGSADRPCTAIGCLDGLHVEVTPPGGAWAPGAYSFEIVTPAGTTTCAGTLPLPACDAGPSLRCSGPPVSIGESGCALPAAQHGFAGIDLGDGPATIAIAISKDGAELTRQTFTPSYRTVSPNGPTCGPTCRQASEALRW
jgi:hypothetical protein